MRMTAAWPPMVTAVSPLATAAPEQGFTCRPLLAWFKAVVRA